MSQLEQLPEPPELPQLETPEQAEQPEQPEQLEQLPQLSQLEKVPQLSQLEKLPQLSQLEQLPKVEQLSQLEQIPQLEQFSQLATQTKGSRSSQRPFYNIAHMVNDLGTMDSFIKEGANAIEVDVAFDGKGVALWTFHGVPCDALRICTKWEKFVNFLKAASTRKIILLMLDLKCGDMKVPAKNAAGKDVAQKLIDHFWKNCKIPVVMSIPWPAVAADASFISGFQEVIRKNSAYECLVAFDLSETTDTNRGIKRLEGCGITNIWLSDGITNWIQYGRGHGRLREMVAIRDKGKSNVKKVYAWSVDYKPGMRSMMNIGVDGFITNEPGRVLDVLRERRDYRLADKEDGFCTRFTKC